MIRINTTLSWGVEQVKIFSIQFLVGIYVFSSIGVTHVLCILQVGNQQKRLDTHIIYASSSLLSESESY